MGGLAGPVGFDAADRLGGGPFVDQTAGQTTTQRAWTLEWSRQAGMVAM
jgi:hypothetical protein